MHLNTTGPNITDPRPDLIKDSALWTRLLILAAKNYPKLYNNLCIMRQSGTRLKKLNTGAGKYGLRPQIGKGCWISNEAYKTRAAELIKPYHNQMVQLLKDFTEQLASDLASSDQTKKIKASLDTQGICIIRSEVLNNEMICFVRDRQAAAGVPGVLKNVVIYTLDELDVLAANPPADENGLRELHQAKKVFGGTIYEADITGFQ